MPTAMLTAYLYFGSRNSQVTTLQSILIADGYLSSAVTGYFGNMTLKAVQKFQCDRNIVCTNDGGWGFVGTRTRAALNTGK
jgi:peptidoglycan hydrolase-like protein with peptidoglycan-binding domain